MEREGKTTTADDVRVAVDHNTRAASVGFDNGEGSDPDAAGSIDGDDRATHAALSDSETKETDHVSNVGTSAEQPGVLAEDEVYRLRISRLEAHALVKHGLDQNQMLQYETVMSRTKARATRVRLVPNSHVHHSIPTIRSSILSWAKIMQAFCVLGYIWYWCGVVLHFGNLGRVLCFPVVPILGFYLGYCSRFWTNHGAKPEAFSYSFWGQNKVGPPTRTVMSVIVAIQCIATLVVFVNTFAEPILRNDKCEEGRYIDDYTGSDEDWVQKDKNDAGLCGFSLIVFGACGMYLNIMCLRLAIVLRNGFSSSEAALARWGEVNVEEEEFESPEKCGYCDGYLPRREKCLGLWVNRKRAIVIAILVAAAVAGVAGVILRVINVVTMPSGLLIALLVLTLLLLVVILVILSQWAASCSDKKTFGICSSYAWNRNTNSAGTVKSCVCCCSGMYGLCCFTSQRVCHACEDTKYVKRRIRGGPLEYVALSRSEFEHAEAASRSEQERRAERQARNIAANIRVGMEEGGDAAADGALGGGGGPVPATMVCNPIAGRSISSASTASRDIRTRSLSMHGDSSGEGGDNDAAWPQPECKSVVGDERGAEEKRAQEPAQQRGELARDLPRHNGDISTRCK